MITEPEFLAVVWVEDDKFNAYFGGSKLFKVITDHNALVSLLNLQEPNGKLAR